MVVKEGPTIVLTIIMTLTESDSILSGFYLL